VNNLSQSWYNSDQVFDELYPEKIQRLSDRHWTPVDVARRSAVFLADAPGKRVLDIGSGIGKFCLIAAQLFPLVSFFGVEQREELYRYAIAAQQATGVKNVSFLHENLTDTDLNSYDNFYFYNSFFENLDEQDTIDDQYDHSVNRYVYYTRYLFNALEERPAGTRLVYFHSLGDEVPSAYQLVDASDDMLLRMYIKR
jgi:SAM-dependent methyltransferase